MNHREHGEHRGRREEKHKSLSLTLRSLCPLWFAFVLPGHAADQPEGNYDEVEQVKAMPECEATVEQKFPCCASFKTTEGSVFFVGSPVANITVVRFVRTLEKGKSYKFPDA